MCLTNVGVSSGDSSGSELFQVSIHLHFLLAIFNTSSEKQFGSEPHGSINGISPYRVYRLYIYPGLYPVFKPRTIHLML